MPKLKPGQRIISFEDFMRMPRSDGEVQCYRALLATAQALGWVDEDLNIVGPERPPTKAAGQ
jgi:hypothetical protein